MGYIERLAEYLAVSIHNNHPESQIAVHKYVLTALLNLIVIISLVLITAAFLGHFIDALICVLPFPILRFVSGGMHFKNEWLCNLVTSFFILLAIYLPIDYWYTGFIINSFAAMILLINTPSGAQGTLDKKFYPILKGIAFLIVSSNFLFQSHILATLFFIQSLTTFSFSQKLIYRFKL
ncbi:accessory gene regulator B family protein [Paenibacillus eucommiae]|uniref:Accessory gene regulator B n=1 Tax=Paenibacillus eucommiae TaxID=1355755 RepID=A0ABS4IUX9_9BACL|nr:accessory gene regulator B family protein [Paenibacillus eucommiae]MBP1991392.1 accessory gene regulator B [Paenibacillus eucommiae]